MRFCLVSTQKNWGGGEVLIASVARELIRAGHTVGWITRADSEVTRRIEQAEFAILHQTRNRGQNLRDWRSVRSVIRNWIPDVLIMNDTHAVPLAGTAAWFSGRVRPLRLAYKHTVFPLRSKLKYRLLADKMICVSNAARQTLVSGGMPEEDTIVVYGGTESPEVAPESRSTIRTELGLPPDQALIVAVGNLLDCKGHSDLIHAIATIGPDANALTVIAGEGGERAKLEKQIIDLGLGQRVKLLGYRSDANHLLQAADLVVHPSHADGLSLVLIQAQMLGRPIVATAVGGAAEVLGIGTEEQGSNWIAQPSDPHSLAHEIRTALQMIRLPNADEVLGSQLGMAAKRASRLFSIERNSLQLVNLAEDLLKQF